LQGTQSFGCLSKVPVTLQRLQRDRCVAGGSLHKDLGPVEGCRPFSVSATELQRRIWSGYRSWSVDQPEPNRHENFPELTLEGLSTDGLVGTIDPDRTR
jgi:hypothetical protein